MLAESILDTIGNTPLVKLNHLSPKAGVNVYAKLEDANPAGSYGRAFRPVQRTPR